MLVTARKAGAKPRDLNTWMEAVPNGFSIATSMTVMRTATRMEMQALNLLAHSEARCMRIHKIDQSWLGCSNSHAADIQLVYFKVLGILNNQKINIPIAAHATVQTVLFVRVLMQMVHIRMWPPRRKICRTVWAQPNTSLKTPPIPIDLPTSPTASPKFWTNGYCFRNSASRRPEYVARALTAHRRMIPGTRPTVARTEGSDRIPRETVSATKRMPPWLKVGQLVASNHRGRDGWATHSQ
jgi:hypothetical protein